MKEYKSPFLLGGLAACLEWLEQLVFTLSAPALTVSTGIAVVSLMTHGQLLNTANWMLYLYAVSLAVGIDSQLPAAFSRVRTAWERDEQGNRNWLALVGWFTLGAYLAYVVFISVMVFGYETSTGLTEAESLLRLGVSPEVWQFQRAALSVMLVAVSGLARIRAKKPTFADERTALERELVLTPMKQQLAQLKATGAVQVARAVGQAAVGKQKPKKPTPNGPSSPNGGTPLSLPISAPEREQSTVLTLPERTRDGRKAAASMTARERVFKLLAKNPNLSKSAIARLSKVSETTASKWRTAWREEIERAEQAAQ